MHHHPVILEPPGRGQVGVVDQWQLVFIAFEHPPDVDRIEQPLGRRVAQGAVVAEDDQLAGGHLAPRRRPVVVEHRLQGAPQQFQVGVGEPGLLGQLGGDEAVRAVQPVGHHVLAAHGAVLATLIVAAFLALLLFAFGGRRHAGDGDFQRQDRLDGAGEGHLHRAAHLAAIDPGAQHTAEGADVVEVVAHEAAQPRRFLVVVRRQLLGLLHPLILRPHAQIRFPVFLVQDRAFLDIDAVPALTVRRHVDVVAHLALQADIGDQALVGLRVEPRQVAGVRVAVRVAVGHVEQIDELVAVLDRGHRSGLVVVVGCVAGRCRSTLGCRLAFGEALVVVADAESTLILKTQVARQAGI